VSEQERMLWILAYAASLSSGEKSAEACNNAANAAVKYAKAAGAI